MTTPMDLSEARRRFEKLLVEAGYSMTGIWAEKPYDGEKDYVCSMALTNMPDTRAVLWATKGKRGPTKWIKGREAPGEIESDGWEAMVAIAVGEDGEFPIMGNKLTRWNSDKWKPRSYNYMISRIEEIRAQVRRWDSSPTGSLGYVAMIKLALNYLSLLKIKKAKSILMGVLRGEIAFATVSEALSIVQMKWCRSREERLRSSLIWASTFK